MRTTEGGNHGAGGGRRKAALLVLVVFACCLLPAAEGSAQEDAVKFVETKRLELKEKEERLKREEERLTALRKDVEEKIAAYDKLLVRLEETLKQANAARGERLDNVVKAYEIMGPEDAAARLGALDEATALRILSRMKSKKAGAVIAAMPTAKAAALTRRMTTFAATEKSSNHR